MTTEHIIRGTLWSLTLRWALRGTGLISTVILARLLTPEDFGIVAMAALVIGLIEVVFDFGIGLLIVRLPQVTREYCDSAWTIKALQGLVMALLIVALSPLAEAYFREPRVVPVLMVMALLPVIRGCENIGIAILLRDQRFGTDFRFRILARVFMLLATVALAIIQRDYWALVYGRLVGTFFATGLSYAFVPHWPRFCLAKSWELLSFSTAIVVRGVGAYLSSKSDVFLVGRLTNEATLGAYHVASELVAIISSELAAAVTRGAYPTYSRLAHEPEEFAQAFLRSLNTTLVICVPLGFGLSVTATDFVGAVFGPKWSAVIPVVEWLAIFGVTYAATWVMSGGALIAIGLEGLSARTAWLEFAIRLPIIVMAGVWWGLDGILRGMVFAGALTLPAVAMLVMRHVRVSTTELLRTAWRPVIAAVLMVLAVKAMSPVNLEYAVVRLAAEVSTGSVVYVIALLTLWWLEGCPAGPEKTLIGTLTSRKDRRGRN